MSPSPFDAPIESVMEDLETQRVLLEIINEEGPDGIDDRDNVLDGIEQLEAKLANLRKNRFESTNSSKWSPMRPTTSDRSASLAQLDGLSDLNPVQSSSPRTPGLRVPQRPDSTQRPSVIPSSKRPFESSGSEEVFGRPSKRSATTYPHKSLSSSPSISSSRSRVEDFQRNSNDDQDDDDEIWELLGLNNTESFRELQDEQRKAEQYLDERKEQERRDAEYARLVQEGLYEPLPPESVASASSPGNSGYLSSSRPASPNTRLDQPVTSRFPGFNWLGPDNPGDTYFSRPPGPFSGTNTRLPRTNTNLSLDPHAASISNSSDSDLVEITQMDFHNSARHPPDYTPVQNSPLNVYPNPYQGMNTSFGPRGIMTHYPSTFSYPLQSSSSWYNSNAIRQTIGKLDQRNLFENSKNSLWDGGFDPKSAILAVEDYTQYGPYEYVHQV